MIYFLKFNNARCEKYIYGRNCLETIDYFKSQKKKKKNLIGKGKIAGKKNPKISILNSFFQSDIFSGEILIDFLNKSYFEIKSLLYFLKFIFKNKILKFLIAFKLQNLEKICKFSKILRYWPKKLIDLKNITNILSIGKSKIPNFSQYMEKNVYEYSGFSSLLEVSIETKLGSKNKITRYFKSCDLIFLINFFFLPVYRCSLFSFLLFFLKFFFQNLVFFFLKNRFVNSLFLRLRRNLELDEKISFVKKSYHFSVNFFQTVLIKNQQEILFVLRKISSSYENNFFFMEKNSHPLFISIGNKIRINCL